LELAGLAKHVKTGGLTGMGPELARSEAAGGVFGHVWNQTQSFWPSKPEPLAGYPAPLETLLVGALT
jgi:hypothetical protein